MRLPVHISSFLTFCSPYATALFLILNPKGVLYMSFSDVQQHNLAALRVPFLDPFSASERLCSAAIRFWT